MDIDELRRIFNGIERRKNRPFGIAGERCPHHGDPIQTFLDTNGRNPMRCCWKCWVEDIDRNDDLVE
jgi:hypothetical protein